MSLPTLAYSPNFRVNQTLGPYGSLALQAQGLLFALKQSLTDILVDVPMTVVSSCDSTTTSASDLWAASTNLVWTAANGTGVRSWIVLEMPVTGIQFLMHCNSSTSSGVSHANVEFVISPGAGFTGGTTSARPTATDEHVLLLPVVGGGVTGSWTDGTTTVSAQRFVLHVIQDEFGNSVKIFLFKNSRLYTYINFGKVYTAPIDAVGPILYWGGCFPNTSDGVDDNLKATYARWNDVTRVSINYNGASYQQTNTGGTGMGRAYCATEMSISSMVGEQLTVANDISGAWWMAPQALISVTQGIRGQLGLVPQVWWTQSSGLANGDTFPSGGSNQFVVFNHMVFPWDGSTPLVA